MSNENEGFRFVLYGLLTILVIAIVTIALWQLHWWFFKENLNHEYKGTVQSQSYQAGVIQDERNRVEGLEKDETAITSSQGEPKQAAESQLVQLKKTFCASYGELSKPPSDLVAAHDKYCP